MIGLKLYSSLCRAHKVLYTELGFMAFTEWIGIFSSDCSGCGHGPPVGLCDFGDSVSVNSHGSLVAGSIPQAGPSPVHMLRGNLTLIHTVNASEPPSPLL